MSTRPGIHPIQALRASNSRPAPHKPAAEAVARNSVGRRLRLR